ncbi:hypothetical protein ACS0PU_013066 [Formica fusca]
MCFCLRTHVISSTKRIYDSISRSEVCLIVSVSLTAEDEGGLFRKLSTNRNWKIIGATGGGKLLFSRATSGVFRNSSETPKTIRHGTNAVTNSREQVGSRLGQLYAGLLLNPSNEKHDACPLA